MREEAGFFASPTHHKAVILRACDFFDLCVFSAYPTSCISSPLTKPSS
jgi:hypothetical protein